MDDRQVKRMIWRVARLKEGVRKKSILGGFRTHGGCFAGGEKDAPRMP